MTSRGVAIDVLTRIARDRAYANVLLPTVLSKSPLDQRDRAFVTELVYGATRMQRACDWLVDRFLVSEVEVAVRAALRAGAYQLAFMDVPSHAAVHETVAAVRGGARKLVNAVLRRVAEDLPPRWPDLATELSYPDWIVARLTADLGTTDAEAMLRTMNTAPSVTRREDGYIQDLGSQLVAALVDAEPGQMVADVCAAPGGKATALAATGASVLASDIRKQRMKLVAANDASLGSHLAMVRADAAHLPYASESLDAVLVDAPCSGLGSLRRRPDARWHIEETSLTRLAALQQQLLCEAARVVKPGGLVLYSVCTLTAAETTDLTMPGSLRPEPITLALWQPRGSGAQLLPHLSGTDGMYAIKLRRVATSG